MRYRVLLGELLPVCGTVGLLGLWLFQQTGIEQRADELRKIAAARSVFQTYQSNNAIFNAVSEVASTETAKDQLRVYQVYNYELGLAAIENALPANQKRGIPPGRSAYDGAPIDRKMALSQHRLELLQGHLAEHEQSVRDSSDADKRKYLILYLVISAVSIAGGLFKVLDKLRPVTQSKSDT